MIKVGIQCHRCDAFVSREVNHKGGQPYWGCSLWRSALAQGWARRRQDQTPFCADCREHLAALSAIVLPVNPLPLIGYVECNTCAARYVTDEIEVGKYFARELRKAARAQGWRLISVDKSQTYQDYCPNCEPDERGKQRLALLALVWSKPTVRVAEELGVSDKAIEKRCKRIGVPKPPPGFWAKCYAGHIDDCLSMLPPIVYDLLGEEFVNEVYSRDP